MHAENTSERKTRREVEFLLSDNYVFWTNNNKAVGLSSNIINTGTKNKIMEGKMSCKTYNTKNTV